MVIDAETFPQFIFSPHWHLVGRVFHSCECQFLVRTQWTEIQNVHCCCNWFCSGKTNKLISNRVEIRKPSQYLSVKFAKYHVWKYTQKSNCYITIIISIKTNFQHSVVSYSLGTYHVEAQWVVWWGVHFCTWSGCFSEAGFLVVSSPPAWCHTSPAPPSLLLGPPAERQL